MQQRVTWLSLLALMLTAVSADAVEIAIERPGEREFIRDLAGMISDADARRIREQADTLLTEEAVPILVVTIESMAQYGPGNLRIETFARILFDQWGIGHEQIEDEAWNKGILLLVSRDDRRARIELGAGWGREMDATAQQIMDEQIVPRFKEGEFSAGIVAGVAALDAMVRGERLPRPPWSLKKWLLVAGLIALGVFTVVSLVRSGSVGWAWLFWGAVLATLGFVLWQLITSSRNSGGGFGGGSFGGGSFGGGFSGGGGATGSW